VTRQHRTKMREKRPVKVVAYNYRIEPLLRERPCARLEIDGECVDAADAGAHRQGLGVAIDREHSSAASGEKPRVASVTGGDIEPAGVGPDQVRVARDPWRRHERGMVGDVRHHGPLRTARPRPWRRLRIGAPATDLPAGARVSVAASSSIQSTKAA